MIDVSHMYSMKSRLEIGALQALCAIRDKGGVSRAAAALALSQSAVSHKIRRLEDDLGCALLDRRPGYLLLTGEGETLLRYARRILALHDEALGTLSTEPLSGRVRLGVTEDATSDDLSRILGRFTRLQPSVNVQIGVMQSRVIGERLDRGDLDVGVMQVFANACRHDDVILARDTLPSRLSDQHVTSVLVPKVYRGCAPHGYLLSLLSERLNLAEAGVDVSQRPIPPRRLQLYRPSWLAAPAQIVHRVQAPAIDKLFS